MRGKFSASRSTYSGAGTPVATGLAYVSKAIDVPLVPPSGIVQGVGGRRRPGEPGRLQGYCGRCGENREARGVAELKAVRKSGAPVEDGEGNAPHTQPGQEAVRDQEHGLVVGVFMGREQETSRVSRLRCGRAVWRTENVKR